MWTVMRVRGGPGFVGPPQLIPGAGVIVQLVKALALYTADLGLIPGVQYGLLTPHSHDHC